MLYFLHEEFKIPSLFIPTVQLKLTEKKEIMAKSAEKEQAQAANQEENLKNKAFSLFGKSTSDRQKELDKVLLNGAHYMLRNEYGIESDIEFCEENGKMKEI